MHFNEIFSRFYSELDRNLFMDGMERNIWIRIGINNNIILFCEEQIDDNDNNLIMMKKDREEEIVWITYLCHSFQFKMWLISLWIGEVLEKMDE